MAAELTDERAAFEAKMSAQGYDISRDERTGGRDYARPATRAAWDGYRAALATQQATQGAEPVFLVATGEVHEGHETYTRHDGAPPPLCDFERLYTAPPPTAEVEKDAARWRFMEANHFQHFTPTGHWKVTDEHGRTIREGTASNFKDAVDAALQSEAQAGKGE